MKKIKIKVELKLVLGHLWITALCCINPTLHLIEMCNTRAKRIRERTTTWKNTANVKFKGFYSIEKNDSILLRVVNKIARIEDVAKVEEAYAKYEFEDCKDTINLEARNVFLKCKVALSTIKCLHRFNCHRNRDSMTNKNLVPTEHPRCSAREL